MEWKEGSKMKIIFGLVGALGTDFNKILDFIGLIMKQFGYDTEEIHLSDFIEKNEDLLKETTPSIVLNKKSPETQYDTYMNGGNALRYFSKNNSILALNAIKDIKEKENADSKKIVYVLNSFKNPDEVKKIKECYGSIFFLIGIHSSKKNRINFLKNIKGIASQESVEKLIERDEDENIDCMKDESPLPKNDPNCHKSLQKTREVYNLADVYISADGSRYYLKEQIERFVSLIFGAPDVIPSKDEYGMYHAYAAALRSGSLSRQVGAAILTESGDLISTGCNDVPKAGGGLYWSGCHDNRDLSYGFDSNRKRLDAIINDITKKMGECGINQEHIEETKQILSSKGKLKNITEYGRTVHAEMEAILSCCRNGVITKDCEMYVTLFSCHNCTKHLICAGIKKVIYVEPYPKSYAKELHGDDIILKDPDESSVTNKVVFEPFIGVSGRRYFDLFSMEWGSGSPIERKDDSDGNIKSWPPSIPEFRFKTNSGTHNSNEETAIKELNEAIVVLTQNIRFNEDKT